MTSGNGRPAGRASEAAIGRLSRAPSRQEVDLVGGLSVVVSSSSLAGGSPVRVAARRPGSRLAARSGNGPGRKLKAKPAASLLTCPRGWDQGEPSPSESG